MNQSPSIVSLFVAKVADAQNSHDVRQQPKQDILDKKRRPLPWGIAKYIIDFKLYKFVFQNPYIYLARPGEVPERPRRGPREVPERSQRGPREVPERSILTAQDAKGKAFGKER